MRFAVAEDAAALRDAADALLTARVTPAVIRSAWATGRDAGVRGIWCTLADIGATGPLVAEAAGGLGLDENALPQLLERIGYSGLPVPAVETVAVAAPLLAAARHPALTDVLSGAAVVTAQLSGTAGPGALVPFGLTADYAILRVGGGLRLYERGELDAERVSTVDGSRHLVRLTASPAGGTLLAGAGTQATESAWQRGVVGTAAVLMGLADRMLSMTVDYVRTRRQFGVPIGSFQAVKHRLADAYLSLEFARPAVLAAAWAQATAVSDAAEQTSMAKALASDAAVTVARAAIQCHGAIGYTTEYDLHLFAKRAWALAPSWGSASWHRRRLAAALGLEQKEGEPGG